jgi:Zn-dependent protease
VFGGSSPSALLRFRIVGIPVDVQPWFLVVAGLGALQLRSPPLVLIWMAIVTASVLWHELGHALTMRRFGYAPRIELHAMGGLAHWPPGANPSARQALLVTAAGPFAGLVLGAIVWLLARGAGPLPYLARIAVDWVVWVNLAWSLFNLLPLLPLDGGNLLDHLSEHISGTARPRWVGWASTVTGGAVVLFGGFSGQTYVALLGAMGAANGIARVRPRGPGGAGKESIEAVRARAQRAASRGNLKRAVAELMPEARVGALPERDLAELVSWLVELERYDELVALCRDRLGAFARRPDVEPLARLAAEALVDVEAYEHALKVAQAAFRQLNIPYHAYDAACHLARIERVEEAMQWLRRAIDAGLDCWAMLRTEPALAPLRTRADFIELVQQGDATKARA